MWFNRHRNLVYAVLLLFVATVMFLVGVVPMYQNLGSLSKKIETKSNELTKLNEQVAIISQLDTNVLAERVKILDSALPTRKDVLLYLSAINGLSQELGLTFGGLSLSPGEVSEATGSAVKGKVVKTVPVESLETEIKIQGNQENVYSFLGLIENVLPLMQIEDIKVSILGEDQYNLTLKLGMLWAPQIELPLKGQIQLFGSEEDKYFEQLSQYRRFESVNYFDTPYGAKSDLFGSPEILTPQQ